MKLGNQRVKTCFNLLVRRQPTSPWKAAVKSSSPLSKGTSWLETDWSRRKLGLSKPWCEREKERSNGSLQKRWQCLCTSSLPWMCYPTKRNQVVRTVASLNLGRSQNETTDKPKPKRVKHCRQNVGMTTFLASLSHRQMFFPSSISLTAGYQHGLLMFAICFSARQAAQMQ